MSTTDQYLDLQLNALSTHRCERIFYRSSQWFQSFSTGLEELKHILRQGDQDIVWKLDRLGRRLRDLVDSINYFEGKDVGFSSIEDRTDTTTPVGQFAFHVFAAVAQFERDIIRVRTLA